jgi:hypothetical protein
MTAERVLTRAMAVFFALFLAMAIIGHLAGGQGGAAQPSGRHLAAGSEAGGSNAVRLPHTTTPGVAVGSAGE